MFENISVHLDDEERNVGCLTSENGPGPIMIINNIVLCFPQRCRMDPTPIITISY